MAAGKTRPFPVQRGVEECMVAASWLLQASIRLSVSRALKQLLGMDLYRMGPSPVAGVVQAVMALLGEVLSRLQLPDRAAASALFLGDTSKPASPPLSSSAIYLYFDLEVSF